MSPRSKLTGVLHIDIEGRSAKAARGADVRSYE